MVALRKGEGPAVVCIHGSAADRSTWTLQLHGLCDTFTVLAHDRRGTARVPLRPGEVPTTEVHADDAAGVIAREAGGGPVLVVGSSYGAIVSLELAARAPERVAGLVLCEPPLSPHDLVPSAPAGFGCAFDRVRAGQGGEAAGEMFLRAVMGDTGFEAVPGRFRRALCATYRQIRADMIALARYRVDYGRLGGIDRPVLLLTGECSPAHYRPALEALERALPRVRRAVIPKAGHAMHVDGHRAFHREVIQFAREIGYLRAEADPGHRPSGPRS